MELTLEAIQFNHQPNSVRNDALNIRRNETDPVIVPEWRRGSTVLPEDSPAAYVQQETHGNALIVKAKFSSPDRSSSTIRVKALNGNSAADPINVLGESRETEVTLSHGQTGLVDFTFSDPKISQIGVAVTDITWRWVYSVEENPNAWIEFAVTHHRIYTVLSIPKFPWTPDSTSASDTQVPWTEVLDFACRWAAGGTDPDAVATAITKKLNQLGVDGLLQYDNPNSAPGNFVRTSPFAFDCTRFLQVLNGGSITGSGVNCDDCAAILVTFANILGCELHEGTMGPPFSPKPHLLIGRRTPHAGKFDHHTVGWKNHCKASDPVFDACLQLNRNNDPANPSWFVPTNIIFGSVSDQDKYRFLLAKVPGDCNPSGIPRHHRIGLSRIHDHKRIQEVSQANPFVQLALMDGVLLRWNVTDYSFIETDTAFYLFESFWKSRTDARNSLAIDAYQCDSQSGAFALAGEIVSTFQLTNLKERTDFGDLGFTTPDRFALVFFRDVFVFRLRNIGEQQIACDDFARKIDQLIIGHSNTPQSKGEKWQSTNLTANGVTTM
jgi:hypothetical protein